MLEPTKLIAEILVFSINASTTSLSPFTTFTNPGGAPAFSYNSTNLIELEGSFSEGFNIKELPQEVATGNIQSGIITGKLKGVIPAHNPSGCRIENVSIPLPTCVAYSPFK